jgi:dTMP kinase
MRHPIPTGLLVAVEGIDGAGKTSVASLLAQWCGERGLDCTISKEPTGLKWGTELRESARAGRLPLEREIELFILDRKDHVVRSIGPALSEGNIVILDRYYWSSAAYQGGRGANYNQIVAENEAFAPKPDLVLVLDLDVDAGLQRIRMRGDNPNLFEGKNGLGRARQIFKQLAEKNSNAVVIDTSGHFRDSFNRALKAFQEVALNKIARSGLSHEEMVLRTKEFFGGEQVAEEWPEGTREVNALLAEARRASS